jgi:PhnB protein
MTTKAKPIPDDYERATPYLICHDATRAIEFYKNAFGATERERMTTPDGKIGHAELKIGGAIIMLADEFPHIGSRSPQSLGGTTVSILIYIENVDAYAARAEAAGAKVLQPVADQFYGDRNFKVADPFGHVWMFATHIEDVPPDEMERRAADYLSKK